MHQQRNQLLALVAEMLAALTGPMLVAAETTARLHTQDDRKIWKAE